jgi:uncharacterized protein YndB with AHSA1/START domain
LPAACDEVFDMWLNPESLTLWMRPGNAPVIYVETNPIVGGTFRFDTQTEDGSIFTHSGEYLEVNRPHKLRFTWNSSVLGENTSQVTVEFYEQAGNCLMVILHDLPPDEAIFADHTKGWAGVMDLLAQHLQMHQK